MVRGIRWTEKGEDRSFGDTKIGILFLRALPKTERRNFCARKCASRRGERRGACSVRFFPERTVNYGGLLLSMSRERISLEQSNVNERGQKILALKNCEFQIIGLYRGKTYVFKIYARFSMFCGERSLGGVEFSHEVLIERASKFFLVQGDIVGRFGGAKLGENLEGGVAVGGSTKTARRLAIRRIFCFCKLLEKHF